MPRLRENCTSCEAAVVHSMLQQRARCVLQCAGAVMFAQAMAATLARHVRPRKFFLQRARGIVKWLEGNSAGCRADRDSALLVCRQKPSVSFRHHGSVQNRHKTPCAIARYPTTPMSQQYQTPRRTAVAAAAAAAAAAV